MEFTLKELANFVQGELIGNENFKVVGCNSLERAQENELAFLVETKNLPDAKTSLAGAFLINQNIEKDKLQKNLILVKNPRLAFNSIQRKFYPAKIYSKTISPQATIHPSVKLGKEVTIYPFVHIAENAEIGDGSILYPNVFIGADAKLGTGCIIYPACSIMDRVIIGKKVIIHSGTVVGSDGFGFETTKNKHHKIDHFGTVEIGDDVEIGANCAIDRGTIENTIIGDGTKLDNLVHIAHNVKLGKHNLLAGQVGIGGSAKLGEHVYCGGQVGILGHNFIEDHVTFYPKSALMNAGKTVPAGSELAGMPAIKKTQWQRNTIVAKRLAELEKRLRKLEQQSK